jgi:hypothetical protein
MILRLLCIWLVFYSLLSSLILSNLKHELLNRLRSTMAANVLNDTINERYEGANSTAVVTACCRSKPEEEGRSCPRNVEP